MDLNFDFKVGQVVKSLKGRDKGEVMIVVEVISSSLVMVVTDLFLNLNLKSQSICKFIMTCLKILVWIRYHLMILMWENY